VWVVREPQPPIEVQIPESVQEQYSRSFSSESSGGGSDSPSPEYAGPNAQAAPASPQRPPTAPVAGATGSFGIAYQTYKGNGTNGYAPARPLDNRTGFRTFVTLAGQSGSVPPRYAPLRNADYEAINFATEMQLAGWEMGLLKDEDHLSIGDLRGTNTPLNGVDIAFLVLHGNYGTSFDSDNDPQHPVKQMYFPIASGGGATYLKYSEMKVGGDGTNGLKWLAFPACFSLYHVNWSSMQGQQVYPYNPGLHLLLGSDTADYTTPKLGQNWVKSMVGDPTATPPRPPVTIEVAWYAGAQKTYKDTNEPFDVNPIKLTVAGDSACQNDMLQMKTNTVLSGSRFYDTPQQVYPP